MWVEIKRLKERKQQEEKEMRRELKTRRETQRGKNVHKINEGKRNEE